jgi:hypothetical protein
MATNYLDGLSHDLEQERRTVAYINGTALGSSHLGPP